jgi:hypothetical protein
MPVPDGRKKLIASDFIGIFLFSQAALKSNSSAIAIGI